MPQIKISEKLSNGKNFYQDGDARGYFTGFNPQTGMVQITLRIAGLKDLVYEQSLDQLEALLAWDNDQQILRIRRETEILDHQKLQLSFET